MNRELTEDELMTKGCDEYHAQKDMRSEADASLARKKQATNLINKIRRAI